MELRCSPTPVAVHRLADGRLYRLDGNAWLEAEPRVDLEKLDDATPVPAESGSLWRAV